MSLRQRSGRNILEDVLYAQCWEDPEIDRAAFRTTPRDDIFTITSGGCNTLAFLLDAPASVTALDLNPAQNYLLELKIAAIRTLSYGQLLGFLGVVHDSDRGNVYHRLREQLTPNAREYWDSKPDVLQSGIVHCGRFEGYLRTVRRCTELLVGRDAIWALFAARSMDERREIYERKWTSLRWKSVTGALLSRSFMSLVFDPAFFAHLDEPISFGAHFEQILRHAFVTLPVSKSPFLSYALLGYFRSHDSLPVYLREASVPIIRSRLDRVSIVHGDCGTYFRSRPADTFSRFNFTNIFEWMSRDTYEHLLRETIRVARTGAVMTYRNLLVRRSHPPVLNAWISTHGPRAQALHTRDLSFLYRTYVVESIHKEPNVWLSQSRECTMQPASAVS